jgi:outer membrane protein assembly factor BamB
MSLVSRAPGSTWPMAAVLFALVGWEARAAAETPYDWLQFGGDVAHSRNNTKETTLGAANVSMLSRVFQATLPATADGAPVILTGVTTSTGLRDLLFVTTKAAHIVALDAHTGATIWTHQYGPGSCHINNGGSACFTTSSPAIDPDRQRVYSYGLDGQVHAYAVGNGAEVMGSGWPELVTNKAFDEKGSSALSFATSGGTTYLYASSGGYPGDGGDYQGHITAINTATGTQNVFNAACSDQAVHFVEGPSQPDCSSERSAVWARGGVVYDSALDRIFFGTGNGDFVPASKNWGDSLLELHPDGTSTGGIPIDSYTPANFAALESADLDLGSTEPGLFPTGANASVPHLAVLSGKDALLRLLNLDNLSAMGGPGHTGGEIGTPIALPHGGAVGTSPVIWTNPADGSSWVFYANSTGISAFQLTTGAGGAPALTTVWTTTQGGTSPIMANGVLYYASSGSLRALAPTTGSVLWSAAIGGIHWESPVVANGMVYLTDESGVLSGFALPPPSPVPLLPRAGTWALACALAVTGLWCSRARRSRSGVRPAP